jgi:hypothetical protein
MNKPIGKPKSKKTIHKNTEKIIGLGFLVDQLSITNCKLFRLETLARDPNISNEERGKLTLEIRALNDNKRVVYRNALDAWGKEDAFWEKKV